MKDLVFKIYKQVGIKSARTKNIAKHIGWSMFYKIGSIIANFMLVPLTINYLNTENYGVWLTLSSFITWFSFFDIGLGHGLRNKFAEAKAINNDDLAKGYVSTAYFSIAIISSIIFLVFIVANNYINWTSIFNTKEVISKELNLLMPIVFGFFSLQMVFKLITTIYTADQDHSMQGKINFYNTAGTLILIWIITKVSASSLINYGSIFSGLPVLILMVISFIGFNKKYKKYRPNFSHFKKIYLKDIFGLGLTFFIIQIAGVVLFSTDNLVITQLFGPESVVPYNISFKYFSISLMILTIIITPYWSSITEAYTKNEFEWIKKSMKNLMKFTGVAIVGVLIMLIIAPFSYSNWIGDKIIIPFSLSLSMALYFIVTIIYMPFTYFINGAGKIKLQMFSILVTAIINIPLSILLAKTLNLGVAGVILATIICIIPHAILCPIQYFKIINNKATGLWDK